MVSAHMARTTRIARTAGPELLGIDVGSSSVMAGVLRGDKVVGEAVRVRFRTRHQGSHVEVVASEVLKAVRTVIHALGEPVRKVDAIALAVMSPAWVAMDARGRPLTPLVTHQ